MAKLYEEGNYVIWDDGGVELPMVKQIGSTRKLQTHFKSYQSKTKG